jgi:hypothetical protein
VPLPAACEPSKQISFLCNIYQFSALLDVVLYFIPLLLCSTVLPTGKTGAQFMSFFTGEVNDRCMTEAKKILY